MVVDSVLLRKGRFLNLFPKFRRYLEMCEGGGISVLSAKRTKFVI